MPTERLPLQRQRRGRLQSDQEMELWMGPGRNGTLFADDAERQAMWQRHRDRLLGYFACGGRRPWAWWKYEGVPELGLRFDFDRQKSILFEAGLLAEAERAELVKFWRKQFDLGRDRELDAGDRESFYRSADIPDSLLRQWAAEH